MSCFSNIHTDSYSGDCFRIIEGLLDNYFITHSQVRSHVMLNNGNTKSVAVSFPAGNSCIAFDLALENPYSPTDDSMENQETSGGLRDNLLEKPDKSDHYKNCILPNDFSSSSSSPNSLNSQNNSNSYQKDKGFNLSLMSPPIPFDSGDGYRGVSFELCIKSRQAEIKGVHMDSVRYVRDLKSPAVHKHRKITIKKYLSLKTAPSYGVLAPEMTFQEHEGENTFVFTRNSIDNMHGYKLVLKTSQQFELLPDNRIKIISQDNKPLILQISASTNFEPLTPWGKDNLLNLETRSFLRRLQENKDEAKLRRFSQSLQALDFLSYKEKLLAGSWRFLTYFGRDTIMTALLMKDCLNKEVFASAFQSVLDRISPLGEAAHEEDVACQAVFRNAEHYFSLQDEYSRSLLHNKLLQNPASPLYDYKMIDDDFMVPLMAREFINDTPQEEVLKFFDKINIQGESNLTTLLRNFNYLLEKTWDYTQKEKKSSLIAIKSGETTGDWRDSVVGLGYGVYPCSVNVDFVGESLSSIKKILNSRLFKNEELFAAAEKYSLQWLRAYLLSPFQPCKALEAWFNAKEYFRVNISEEEIRQKLKHYLEKHTLTQDEREYFRKVSAEGVTLDEFLEGVPIPSLMEGITFYALSLDENCLPIAVMNSDSAFRLFCGNPPLEEIEAFLKILRLPFPLGLSSPYGIFVSNPVYSEDSRLWSVLDQNAYHGTVVWSWHMAMIEKGLMKQIKRFSSRKGFEPLIKDMKQMLEICLQMDRKAGDLINSELWTYEIREGEMFPVPFGEDSKASTVSNPVQLWSAAGISVMKEYEEISSLF